jgi:hypothetical protein
MNGMDNIWMYQVMRTAHCPDPGCIGRYQPSGFRGRLRQQAALLLAKEGMTLASLDEHMIRTGAPGSTAQTCC